MVDYVQIFDEGDDITLTVGATAVVAGNLVMMSVAKSVIPTTGATNAWIGVATTDAAIGAKVGIVSGGVQELVANAAVAVGADVSPGAAGKVGAVGTAFQRVGVAMTAALADGDKIWVKMER